MKTIGGKSMNEIIRGLEEDFPDDIWIKHEFIKNVYYLPYHIVVDRMDTVVGSFYYDFIVGRPNFITIEEKEAIVVDGVLTLHCDDGTNISKGSLGGAQIIKNKNGIAISIPNDANNAANDAFKRCAKLFGVGRKRKVLELKEQTEELFKLEIHSPFLMLPKGGVKAKSSEGDIIFWQREWEKLSEKYTQFRIGEKIKNITFYGVRKTYQGNPQIQFIKLKENNK